VYYLIKFDTAATSAVGHMLLLQLLLLMHMIYYCLY